MRGCTVSARNCGSTPREILGARVGPTPESIPRSGLEGGVFIHQLPSISAGGWLPGRVNSFSFQPAVQVTRGVGHRRPEEP